jgi:hypothetical protein
MSSAEVQAGSKVVRSYEEQIKHLRDSKLGQLLGFYQQKSS